MLQLKTKLGRIEDTPLESFSWIHERIMMGGYAGTTLLDQLQSSIHARKLAVAVTRGAEQKRMDRVKSWVLEHPDGSSPEDNQQSTSLSASPCCCSHNRTSFLNWGRNNLVGRPGS